MARQLSIRITSGPLAGRTGTIDSSEFDPSKMELAGVAGTMNRALPTLGGIAGAGAGMLAGPLGAGGGAAAGYLGGKTLQRAQLDALTNGASSPSNQYLKSVSVGQPDSSKYISEPFQSDLTGAATAGLAGMGAQGLTMSLPALWRIIQGQARTGKQRETMASRVPVTYEETKKATERAISPKSLQSTQMETSKTGRDWLSQIFPDETLAVDEWGRASAMGHPESIPGDVFYKRLGELEGQAKAYAKSEGASKTTIDAAKATSRLLRDLMNEKSPELAQINKTLSWMQKNKGAADTVKSSTAKFGLYRILSKIFPFI